MKWILVVLILVSASLFGQTKPTFKLGIGLDIANTFYGGTVNSRAVNFTIEALIRDNYYNVEAGLGYERFDKLNFEVWLMQINKVIPVWSKTEFIIGGEHGFIHRWKGYLNAEPNSKQLYYSYGVNGEFRYDLSDKWQIGLKHNFRNRTDINKWIGSNLITLKYNL